MSVVDNTDCVPELVMSNVEIKSPKFPMVNIKSPIMADIKSPVMADIKSPKLSIVPKVPKLVPKLVLKPRPPVVLPKKDIIELYPPQVDHLERLKKIAKYNPVILDFSMLGTGKTFTSSYLALALGFRHVIVICPPSLEHRWSEMKTKYGIPIDQIISYNSLRSTKCHQPKHGLLSRYDYITQSTNKRGMTIDINKVYTTQFLVRGSARNPMGFSP